MLGFASVARAESSSTSPWHFDLDVAFGGGHASFATVALPADVPPEVAAQQPVGHDIAVARIGASIGLAGLALEGGFTTSLGTGAYDAWNVGVRLESAWRDTVSISFRTGYVSRIDVDGEGARFGLGVIVRPVLALNLYAEVFTDVTTVPDAMHESGALFAYLLAGSAGVRVAFR